MNDVDEVVELESNIDEVLPQFNQFMGGAHNRFRRSGSSGSRGTFGSPLKRPANQKCTKPKPIIKKAFTRCSAAANSCIVRCANNHQFPNGKTSVKLFCDAGEWVLEDLGKNDKLACEPKRPCPAKPEMQQAEASKCGPSNCTVTCAEGHALPDGTTTMQMICKNGKWTPSNEDQSFPPHCECKSRIIKL